MKLMPKDEIALLQDAETKQGYIFILPQNLETAWGIKDSTRKKKPESGRRTYICCGGEHKHEYNCPAPKPKPW